MDEAAIQYLGDVQRLALNDGDIVVVKVDRAISTDMATRLREKVAEAIPGHKVIVLDAGIELGVLGKEAA